MSQKINVFDELHLINIVPNLAGYIFGIGPVLCFISTFNQFSITKLYLGTVRIDVVVNGCQGSFTKHAAVTKKT